ncbi:MAG: hypothetical protein CM15mP92_2140 [Halieaceae bacterium]|nr:MAG: hypothetical protein CM15mP92_2140 [Halieaceae bacterium]
MGLACLRSIWRVFVSDASAGGWGAPFAPGAKGNVATEDVVMLCESIGYDTGLDMPSCLRLSRS